MEKGKNRFPQSGPSTSANRLFMESALFWRHGGQKERERNPSSEFLILRNRRRIPERFHSPETQAYH